MKKTKILILVLLILSLTMSGLGGAFAAEAGRGDIVILATNDVHNGVDATFASDGAMETMGYANLAAYKAEMERAVGEESVILIDAGDAIQGEAIGTLSKGSYLIDIMNYLGYDLAVPGNHEFDYGMERLLELADMADFSYLASNLIDLRRAAPVFEPYKILESNGTKIAFVGVTTPEAFTKSDPKAFQDSGESYIYGFCEGGGGLALYANVQASVDAARAAGAAGADFVIAVAHLGTDEESRPWTSGELIANTGGIDAVIDGHSHSEISGESVKNAKGESVLLIQAGTKLSGIGKIVIKADGSITAELVHSYSAVDTQADSFIKEIQSGFAEDLNKVVAKTEVGLFVNRPDGSGERIIRSMETNLGNLCADAYREVLGADIAFANGGGIRADIPAGDITYGQIISVHPYGNMMCVAEVTGQQILDALELGSSACPEESGGFLHVSGMSYTIDTTIPSGVRTDEKGNFLEVTGERRVRDVKVAGRDIEPARTYTLASHNYMLKSGGDGFNMFMDCRLLQDEVMLDNQLLIDYITDNLGGVVGEEYHNPYGRGRIKIISYPFEDIGPGDWFAADVAEAVRRGLTRGVSQTHFAPLTDCTRAMMATFIYRLEGEPEVTGVPGFSDVDEDSWYADAVAWGVQSGILSGRGDGSFDPDGKLSRQDAVTMLYRYALYKNYEPVASEGALDSFSDSGSISEYARDAMEWAAGADIVQGNLGRLEPGATASRAQTAVLLLRFDLELSE